MKHTITSSGLGLALAFACPATAQDTPIAAGDVEEAVFDGDFITVGAGGVYSPSYLGSDDYIISPIPVILGSYGGVDFSPRGAGLSVDFVPDPDEGIGLILGVTGRLRSDRASRIKDDVVKSLGELDRAVEIGPVVGVTTSNLLNPYDSLTFDVGIGWDVAGAHDGMAVQPTLVYSTPLSRALIASLAVSAEYADADMQDYYFRVTPQQELATDGVLPAFEPDGGGFTRAGANLLLAYDLNGDVTDGGLGVFGVLGYSRVLGDAKRSPYTSVRGSADQFVGGLGLGYTF